MLWQDLSRYAHEIRHIAKNPFRTAEYTLAICTGLPLSAHGAYRKADEQTAQIIGKGLALDYPMHYNKMYAISAYADERMI